MTDSDGLAERVARLQEETDRASRDRKTNARYSRTERARVDTATGIIFLHQFFLGLKWLWINIALSTLRLLRGPSGWVWGQYRRAWAFAVYRRMSDDVMLFSKTRAGLFIAATWFVGWFLLIPIIDCVWDAAIYAATARRDEHVYLLGSQEINSWTGAHVIEGCSRLPCSDTDAVYFRTEGGLFNNLWSLIHHGGLFYPEYVGAAVPYTTSKCVITSYGLRVRFPFRIINMYSYLLMVTCEPQ